MTDEPSKPVVSKPAATLNGTAIDGQLLAAIDLGSNSFNLLICRWQDQTLTRVVRCKQIVQLVRDADTNGNLHSRSIKRALKSLHEFGDLLRQHQPNHVDIIGTEALRRAPNSSQFLGRAETLLGGQIALISPQKEAELGYYGVQYYQPGENKPVLVIDIGGASTELTLGSRQSIHNWHSLEIGCVSLANQFFGRGNRQSQADKVRHSYNYCCARINEVSNPFLLQGWQLTLGASGIMRIIADLLPQQPDTIVREDLTRLLNAVTNNRRLKDAVPNNLRRGVLPAGLVLLCAIFDGFKFQQLQVSPGNVKYGMMLERLSALNDSQPQDLKP